jgi:hypothetical protein
MGHEGIILGESVLVEQQIDSFSSGEFIALVLRVDSLLPYGKCEVGLNNTTAFLALALKFGESADKSLYFVKISQITTRVARARVPTGNPFTVLATTCIKYLIMVCSKKNDLYFLILPHSQV